MPWIRNIPLRWVVEGEYPDPGANSMLIQIVDPAMEFPMPATPFKETHQFEFIDLEATDTFAPEFKITPEQAAQLVELLRRALAEDMNVVVHCVAGVCRSGAVCEVGVMMGFEDTDAYRASNLLVKHLMMRSLGWTYD